MVRLSQLGLIAQLPAFRDALPVDDRLTFANALPALRLLERGPESAQFWSFSRDAAFSDPAWGQLQPSPGMRMHLALAEYVFLGRSELGPFFDAHDSGRGPRRVARLALSGNVSDPQTSKLSQLGSVVEASLSLPHETLVHIVTVLKDVQRLSVELALISEQRIRDVVQAVWRTHGSTLTALRIILPPSGAEVVWEAIATAGSWPLLHSVTVSDTIWSMPMPIYRAPESAGEALPASCPRLSVVWGIPPSLVGPLVARPGGLAAVGLLLHREPEEPWPRQAEDMAVTAAVLGRQLAPTVGLTAGHTSGEEEPRLCDPPEVTAARRLCVIANGESRPFLFEGLATVRLSVPKEAHLVFSSTRAVHAVLPLFLDWTGVEQVFLRLLQGADDEDEEEENAADAEYEVEGEFGDEDGEEDGDGYRESRDVYHVATRSPGGFLTDYYVESGGMSTAVQTSWMLHMFGSAPIPHLDSLHRLLSAVIDPGSTRHIEAFALAPFLKLVARAAILGRHPEGVGPACPPPVLEHLCLQTLSDKNPPQRFFTLEDVARRELPRLRSLHLRGTVWSPTGVAKLQRCVPALRQLRVSHSAISDVAVCMLWKMRLMERPFDPRVVALSVDARLSDHALAVAAAAMHCIPVLPQLRDVQMYACTGMSFVGTMLARAVLGPAVGGEMTRSSIWEKMVAGCKDHNPDRPDVGGKVLSHLRGMLAACAAVMREGDAAVPRLCENVGSNAVKLDRAPDEADFIAAYLALEKVFPHLVSLQSPQALQHFAAM